MGNMKVMSIAAIVFSLLLATHGTAQSTIFDIKTFGGANQNITIIVDKNGGGNFTSIQSAIDFVPKNSLHWTFIHIKVGIYREKLMIPKEKSKIVILDQGVSNTIVEWDDHKNTSQSVTFSSEANNTIVKFISFKNTYNYPKNNKPMKQAVAARVKGDKTLFYNVGFFSLQDTLWDDRGRHYYKNCTIVGGVDFIFGAGQSIYDECLISVISNGFITAQGRDNPEDSNVFVFKNCNISGSGQTYLGRPWRDYARVVFYNTSMADIIKPIGWDAGASKGFKERLTFDEVRSYGPGSNMAQRASWTNKLDIVTVQNLTSIPFIDTEGWLHGWI